MKILNHFNSREKSEVINKEPHATIPNQSYTIAELFEMHRNNIRLPIDEYTPYFDELDIEEFSAMKEPSEDFIDWYNRLSDFDRQAVIDTLEARHSDDEDESNKFQSTQGTKSPEPGEED